MMLFDLIRKLNEDIAMFVNDGLPGKIVPRIIGSTDGFNVHIHFVDKLVWDSTEWESGPCSAEPTDAELLAEMRRIEAHIKEQVMEYLTSLYNIQW